MKAVVRSVNLKGNSGGLWKRPFFSGLKIRILESRLSSTTTDDNTENVGVPSVQTTPVSIAESIKKSRRILALSLL